MAICANRTLLTPGFYPFRGKMTDSYRRTVPGLEFTFQLGLSCPKSVREIMVLHRRHISRVGGSPRGGRLQDLGLSKWLDMDRLFCGSQQYLSSFFFFWSNARICTILLKWCHCSSIIHSYFLLRGWSDRLCKERKWSIVMNTEGFHALEEAGPRWIRTLVRFPTNN